MEQSTLTQDFNHLLSFRGSDLIAIQASKVHFDSLSKDPLTFIQRMISLLEKNGVNQQEKNLIVFFLNKVIKDHESLLGIKQNQYLIKCIWEVCFGNEGVLTECLLELILFLLSKTDIQTLHHYLSSLIIAFWDRYCDKSLKLLSQIIKCQAISVNKVKSFKNVGLYISHWKSASFNKQNYIDLIIGISYLCDMFFLDLSYILDMFPYNPKTISKILRQKYLKVDCKNDETIFAYLLESYFTKTSNKCSQQTIQSIFEIIELICSSSSYVDKRSSEQLATCSKEELLQIQNNQNSHVISSLRSYQYMNWLVCIFIDYQSKIIKHQIEQDSEFLLRFSHHLSFLSTTYSFLFIFPISQIFSAVFQHQFIPENLRVSGYYFILSHFIPLVSFAKLPTIITQIQFTQNKKIKLSLGFLMFLQKYIRYYFKQSPKQNSNELFNIISSIKFDQENAITCKILIQIYLIFIQSANFDFTQVVCLFDQLPNDIQRYKFMELFLQHTKHIDINQNFWQLVIGWTMDFNVHPDYIKILELQIISLLLKYDGDIANFQDLFTHVKGFAINSNILDNFSQMITIMIKTYNKWLYSLEGFPQYCQSIFHLASKQYDVYDLGMEIVNLPSQNTELLVRFFRFLIQNIDITNTKLLDLIQVFTIYYPVTSSKQSQNILKRLNGKEYYRFYWRLKPNHPPTVGMQFKINNMVVLKWVILSYIFMFDRSYKNICSRQEENIQSLIQKMGQLYITEKNNQYWNSLVEMFLNMEDNETHWIGSWEDSSVKNTIKRDFNEQSKRKILERHQKVINPLQSVDMDVRL